MFKKKMQQDFINIKIIEFSVAETPRLNTKNERKIVHENETDVIFYFPKTTADRLFPLSKLYIVNSGVS